MENNGAEMFTPSVEAALMQMEGFDIQIEALTRRRDVLEQFVARNTNSEEVEPDLGYYTD